MGCLCRGGGQESPTGTADAPQGYGGCVGHPGVQAGRSAQACAPGRISEHPDEELGWRSIALP